MENVKQEDPAVAALRDALTGGFAAITELDVAVRVYSHGVRFSRFADAVPAVLQEVKQRHREAYGEDPPELPIETEWIHYAPKKKEFAVRELEAGSPYLFGLCSVRLWSVLEALIDDVALARIRFDPGVRQSKLVREIEVPFADFMDAPEGERAELLASAVKDKVRSRLKNGVGKFEALLDAVGLGGPVQEGVRRAMLELSAIRNVLVHRSGIADRRLVEACPWLQFQVGDEVRVREIQFDLYIYSSDWYLLEIARRVEERCGGANSFEQGKLRSQGADLIELVWQRRREQGIG